MTINYVFLSHKICTILEEVGTQWLCEDLPLHARPWVSMLTTLPLFMVNRCKAVLPPHQLLVRKGLTMWTLLDQPVTL